MISSAVIIPARAGSKGLPGKNVMLFNGDPLLARAVRTARASSASIVVVSSDSPEYLAIAREAGANQCILRPAALASDEASSESVLLHALDQLPEAPEFTLLMQCTTPFTTAGHIDTCLELLYAGYADTVFTGTKTHCFSWYEGPSGWRQGLVPGNHSAAFRLTRQARKVEWIENGGVYGMNTALFRQQQLRFFGTVRVVEVPGYAAVEIDTAEDFEIARCLIPLSAVDKAATCLQQSVLMAAE